MMKKEIILKILIVTTGIALSYIRYNLIQIDNKFLELYMFLLLILFMISIYILNNKVFKLKNIIVNEKLKLLLKSIFQNNKQKPNNILQYSILGIVSILISVFMGFLYKKPNWIMLMKASSQGSKWKKEIYLDMLREKASFFQLQLEGTKFVFNWLAFLVTALLVLIIFLIIKKTTILDRYLKPFIK